MNPSLSPLRLPAGALNTHRPLRATSQLLALEQRFMFDGAVAVADAAQAAHDSAPAVPPVPPAVEVRAAEPAKDQGKKEVVLVDTSLANYKSLEAGVRDGVGIVEFDGNRDGLAQIAQWAASQSGLDAIHILSHGSQGLVNLGTTQLNQASLGSAATQAELAQLGQALASGGDLLLYGCDVAAGDGAQLLAGIARATGADVAASTDMTGAARLGGDWTLEAHSGDIDARALALMDYDGALAVVTFVDADSPGGGYVQSIVKDAGGKSLTFTGPNLAIDAGPMLYAGDTNLTGATELTATIQNGSAFDLASLKVDAVGTVAVKLTYFNGSTLSFNIGPTAGLQTITSGAFGVSALNIVKMEISSASYAGFQDFNVTVKSTPATTVSSAVLSNDTGVVGDFVTSIAAQKISGQLSTALLADERVEVSYDGGFNWTGADVHTVGSKDWSTNTTLSGSGTFLARVSNALGGGAPKVQSYRLDTTAPTTGFSGYALSADYGRLNNDLITNSVSQTITATLSASLASGDTVWGSTDNGNSWTNVTSKVSGTTLTWTGATLDAVNQTLRFRVTDQAGNDGPESVQAYTLDTTAPSTAVSTVNFSNDSGTSPSDFVTNMASQTVSGTLSANLAPGETVYVSLDNGATWAAATAAVGQSSWTLGRTLAGSNTLKVRVTDTAGNDGTVLSQAYTYDTTAPATTFSNLALSADTGPSNTDFITRIPFQTITATLSGALAGTDILYGSLDNGASWTDITSKVAGTTLSWNGVTLAGSNTLQLKVTDAAGNTGGVLTKAYVLDTSGPATPGTPVLASASDTGSSNSDGVTADNTPTLSGTAENGSTVTIFDGATLLGSVVAGAGGWSYTTNALANGSHSIVVVATDTAGNPASSAALSFTVDTDAPATTAVAVPANGTYYTGDRLDFTVVFDEAVTVDTTGGTPRIAMVVGATTRYASYVSGSGTSALTFRYTVVNGDADANGITVNALSLNGASLRDAAGNDASTILNSVGSTAGVNVDGSLPSITGVGASTADGSYGAGQTVTITVQFSGNVTVDTTNGTPTLALDGGGSATYTGGSGGTTLTFSYIVGAGQNSADLDYISSAALALNGATITDAGGSHQNAVVVLATPGTAGSLGANKNLVIDTTAPTNTVDGASFSADTGSSGSDFITKTAAQTISGTLASNLSAGENVYVSLDNGSTWTLATASVGTKAWSLAGQTLTGSGTLKVRVTDNAGNSGVAYSQAYVLDTTAPTIGFGGVALSADTGTAGDLITNTAAQTISATLSGAPAAGDVVYGSLDNGATWADITSKVSGTTLTWNGVTLAGSDTLKLRVTDAAGNNGAATSAAYVLDTTGPTSSVASVAFSADSGASMSDFLTNVAAQTLSGTLSANLAAGERVFVSLDNGNTWTAANATVGSSAWSLAGQTLTGSNTLQIKVSDVAGNDGPVLSQSYVFDTTAPAATFSGLALSADTGTSPSDFITGVAAQTLTATLGAALAPGEMAYGSLDGGNTWTDITGKISGTTLVWNGITLAGSGTLLLRVTDLAGNDSISPAQTYAVDTTAPAMSLGNLALSADTGTSNSDFLTRTAAQTITATLGSSLAPGDVLYGSVDGGTTWQDITSRVSGTALTWSGVTLAGSSTLMFKIADAAGNESASLARNYTLDTTAPATMVSSATRAGDGSVSGLLSGPLAAGELVAASLDGGATWVLATVGADGASWSIANAGSGALQVQVLDAAGNASTPLRVEAVAVPVQPPAVSQPLPPVVPPVPPVPRALPSEALPSEVLPAEVHSPATPDAPAVPPLAAETPLPGSWVSSLDNSPFALDSGALSRGLDAWNSSAAQATYASFLTRPAADGAFQILVLPELRGTGESLVANRPIGDFNVHGGSRLSLQLPVDSFAHADDRAAVELSAQSADGTPLPRWLKFDARTARFEGTPPLAFEGTLIFKVVARDAQGREAVQVFKVIVSKDAGIRGAHAGWHIDLAEPAGRASLSEQLRAAGGASAERLARLSQSAPASPRT